MRRSLSLKFSKSVASRSLFEIHDILKLLFPDDIQDSIAVLLASTLEPSL